MTNEDATMGKLVLALGSISVVGGLFMKAFMSVCFC